MMGVRSSAYPLPSRPWGYALLRTPSKPALTCDSLWSMWGYALGPNRESVFLAREGHRHGQ